MAEMAKEKVPKLMGQGAELHIGRVILVDPHQVLAGLRGPGALAAVIVQAGGVPQVVDGLGRQVLLLGRLFRRQSWMRLEQAQQRCCFRLFYRTLYRTFRRDGVCQRLLQRPQHELAGSSPGLRL